MTYTFVIYAFTMIIVEFVIKILFCCLVFYAVLRGLNSIHLKRYRQIMLVIEREHPNLYDRVCPSTDFKRAWKGYQRAQPLIELSKSTELSEYPVLARQLTDFVKFDRNLKQIRTAAIVVMLILGAIFAVLIANGRL